ncbi:beta-lactamase family protein [Enterococcus sp. BWM-S5]|uniref:Beta-lactamase family protein n=1 Tax=Enterococcus larvae TaxID=2794352 RepID=A0ABS4CFA2_9ENTE|nr:serine hydrolase domain-containing protein [Enterococcus larvae]MBP1045110.1 beta-lactamase family protein [Enterococcus larvae]
MNKYVISEEIKAMIDQKIISGASWSFVSEEKVENHYAGVMGVQTPFSERKIEEGLLYDLASLTKVIGTTTRILQLIDEGSLRFTTAVNEIIPSFTHIQVTISDLLLHKGGLPAEFPEKEAISRDILKKYFAQSCLPKSEYDTVYSDVGFLLLGEVIKEMDSCSLERSFQKHIFEPLMMKHTGFQPIDKNNAVPTEQTAERGIIQGEVHDSKAFKMDGEVGSAGLFSTLEDVAGFVKAYVTEDRRLFSKSIFDKLRDTAVNERTLGWEQKENSRGRSYLFHTGFTGTSIGLEFEGKNGFILLTNRVHPNRKDRGFIEARAALYTAYF